MAKRRISRYSRRTSYSAKKSRALPVIICVVVFLLLCFLISVAIGLILARKTPQSNIENPQFSFEKYQYEANGKTIKSVEAYFFENGASPIDYKNQGIDDFSFCIRNKDGSLNYKFKAGEEFGIDENRGEMFIDEISSLIHTAGGYSCGYVYITSFSVEDDFLREVYKAYELALIHEAAQSGIDDILLVGIDVNEKNISEVEGFVARASGIAGNTALGVLMKKDAILLTNKEIYLAGRMKNACDYLAIDMTHLTSDSAKNDKNGESELIREISEIEYYVSSYKLRLVFDRGNSILYKSAVSLGVVDLQVVDN